MTPEPNLVEAAERLLELARQPILDRTLPQAGARRASQLRDHLTGHILPRARSLDAPLVVLVFGPTGAGKSSLVNGLAGTRASPAGIIRPTTRDVVVVAREEARAAVVGDGTPLTALGGEHVRFVASDAIPPDVAVLDSPDVDSVEHANRELTDRLVEAADLGIFVTTATRYADRVPWEVLARSRDRGLPLIVVLNRMPVDAGDAAVVLADVTRLLADAHVRTEELELVSVHEGAIDLTDDALPASAIKPINDRITALGRDRDARRELAVRALSGSLAGLGPLVSKLADDVEHAAIDADALRRQPREAFEGQLATLRDILGTGSFMRTEAVRQWHAFVGADEITRFFSRGIGRIRGTLSAMFRGMPRAPVAEVREDTVSDIIALARTHAGEAARRAATAWSDEPMTRELVAADPGLWSVSPEFDKDLRSRLEAWISSIGDDVQRTGGPKRFLARGVSIGVNAAGIAVMLGTFAHTGGLTGAEVGITAATGFLNQKLLEALFGEAALVEMIRRARTGLAEAVTASFEEERERYARLVPDGPALRLLGERLRAAASEVTGLRVSGPI
jgi:hypothetical protein